MDTDENAHRPRILVTYMRVNEAIEPNDEQEHKPGFPCPVCDVITIRQPWASLIALGIKHYEFRSSNFQHRGAVVIHASKNWYTPGLREIVRFHFKKYTLKPDEAIQALFPVSRPVADAVVLDCKPWGEKMYALTLDRVRIITQPKPSAGWNDQGAVAHP
jgi:hypothetical protein